MQNLFILSMSLSAAALLSACNVKNTNLSKESDVKATSSQSLKLEDLVAILPDFAEPDFVVFGKTENHSGETFLRTDFKIVLGGDCKNRSLLVTESGTSGTLNCVTSSNQPPIKIATLGEGQFVESTEGSVPDKVLPLKFVSGASLKHLSGNTFELNVKAPAQSAANELDVFVGQEIWIFKDVKQFDPAGTIHCYSDKDEEISEISLSDTCSVTPGSKKLNCKISGFLFFSSNLEAQWSNDWLEAANTHNSPLPNSKADLRWTLKITDASKKQFSKCYQKTSGTFVRAE